MALVSNADMRALAKVGITNLPTEKRAVPYQKIIELFELAKSTNAEQYLEGSIERLETERALSNLRAVLMDMKYRYLRKGNISRVDGSCVYSTAKNLNDVGELSGTRL